MGRDNLSSLPNVPIEHASLRSLDVTSHNGFGTSLLIPVLQACGLALWGLNAVHIIGLLKVSQVKESSSQVGFQMERFEDRGLVTLVNPQMS